MKRNYATVQSESTEERSQATPPPPPVGPEPRFLYESENRSSSKTTKTTVKSDDN